VILIVILLQNHTKLTTKSYYIGLKKITYHAKLKVKNQKFLEFRNQY